MSGADDAPMQPPIHRFVDTFAAPLLAKLDDGTRQQFEVKVLDKLVELWKNAGTLHPKNLELVSENDTEFFLQIIIDYRSTKAFGSAVFKDKNVFFEDAIQNEALAGEIFPSNEGNEWAVVFVNDPEKKTYELRVGLENQDVQGGADGRAQASFIDLEVPSQ